MISDTRLQHLCSPEYALSEAGQLAAELYAARQAIRIISAERDEGWRPTIDRIIGRMTWLKETLRKYGDHWYDCPMRSGGERCECQWLAQLVIAFQVKP